MFFFPSFFLLFFFFLFPQTCQSCFKTIPKGDVVVLAEFEDNSESSACYHAACFCCCICLEWLVDLTYYRYGNKIYCGRHHAELSKQRCFGCDEVSSYLYSHKGHETNSDCRFPQISSLECLHGSKWTTETVYRSFFIETN